MKVAERGITTQELKDELKEIKTWKSRAPKDRRLEEIARHFASEKQWDLAFETLEIISNEKERNLLIADIIETYLLPAQEIAAAKKFAKYITPINEIEPFIWIKIALAEHDSEQAEKIAQHLPSPLSRNFAFLHLMESYLEKKEKIKADRLAKLMIENIRTIYDNKIRSYILRELALNLFLPNNEKTQAIDFASLIPDETIKAQVVKKINTPK